MQAELKALITRHCATIVQKTEKLSGLVSDLRRGDVGQYETIERAIALAHEIRGSAGSIGFDEISTAAAGLERALRALMPAPENDASLIDHVLRRQTMLENAAERLTPESSRLFDIDLSAFSN